MIANDIAPCTPQLGTWLATQACAPMANWIGDLLVHNPSLNPLSQTSQGMDTFHFLFFDSRLSNGCDTMGISLMISNAKCLFMCLLAIHIPFLWWNVPLVLYLRYHCQVWGHEASALCYLLSFIVLVCKYTVFPEPFIEKTVLSAFNELDSLLEKSFDHICKGLYLGSPFYSIAL